MENRQIEPLPVESRCEILLVVLNYATNLGGV